MREFSASGSWSLVGARIFTEPMVVEVLFESLPLGELEVLEGGEATRLLWLNRRSLFDRNGLSRYSCFAKED